MNKKIIADYMEAVWNQKNFAVIDEVFSDKAVIHSSLGSYRTPGEMMEVVQKWTTAIPDMKVTLENLVEENGFVVAHWTSRGTHQKELNSVKPNGKPIEYQGVSMYRLENSKVVEYWAFVDNWLLHRQMTGD